MLVIRQGAFLPKGSGMRQGRRDAPRPRCRGLQILFAIPYRDKTRIGRAQSTSETYLQGAAISERPWREIECGGAAGRSTHPGLRIVSRETCCELPAGFFEDGPGKVVQARCHELFPQALRLDQGRKSAALDVGYELVLEDKVRVHEAVAHSLGVRLRMLGEGHHAVYDLHLQEPARRSREGARLLADAARDPVPLLLPTGDSFDYGIMHTGIGGFSPLVLALKQVSTHRPFLGGEGRQTYLDRKAGD